MTIFTNREKRELERDFGDHVRAMSRPFVMRAYPNKTNDHGIVTKGDPVNVELVGMRRIPSPRTLEFYKNELGYTENVSYQVVMLASVLVAGEISEIGPDNIFIFPDEPLVQYQPITGLINRLPYGSSELAKTVFLKKMRMRR